MNKLLFTFIAIIVAFCALVNTYDFEDVTFNQILAQGLEEGLELLENDVPLHPRYRRDEEAANTEKCRRWRPKFCCGDDILKEIHEKDRDFKRECFKQVFGKDRDMRAPGDPFKCEKMDKHKKDMICVFQCVAQKKSMVDDDGNLNEDVVKEMVKSGLGKLEWFSSLVDDAITKCVSEAKNASTNRDTSDVDACNPASMKLLHCLFRETQLNCPANQIKDEKACSKLQERLKKTNDFFVPPPSPAASLEE